MNYRNHKPSHSLVRTDGYLVAFVIVLTLVLGSIGFSVAQTVAVKYTKTKREIATSAAIYTAEAGISDTVAALAADPTFTGYATNKTYYSDTVKGKAEYISSVTGTGSTRKVIATGYVYSTPTSTTPLVARKVGVLVRENADSAAGGPAVTPYTIYAGSGGVSVLNNSRLFGAVSGPGGMYIKGKLTVTGNSDAPLYPFPFFASSPANMYVNNTSCTAGTVYPVACSSPEQPITVSSDSSVNGIVCAPGQTDNTSLISQPGLQSACAPPILNDAIFDKAAYTSTMTATPKASSITASRCSSTVDEITWTDRTTYTGNLDTSTRDCEIRVLGNIHIKGNLSLGSNTKIILPYDLRATPPTIVVDGTVTLSGTVFLQQNSATGGVTINGAPIRIISFASPVATCSTSNTCTTPLTSTARKTYETTTNIQCINTCRTSSSLLWSYYGTVLVDTNSEAGMVNGQGVIIRNSSSAGHVWNPGTAPGPAFGSGTTMPYGAFTTDILGGTAQWEVTDYRRIYE